VHSRSRRTGILAALAALVVTVLAPETGATTLVANRLVVRSGPGGSVVVTHWTAGSRPVTFYPLAGRRPAGRAAAFDPVLGQLLQAQVSATPVGAAMAPGFIGLSLEYRAVTGYLGRDPSALDPVFLALVRALDPGQSPTLRIGGNSTDQTWWPVPGAIRPRGVNYALGNDWLRVARGLATDLGAKLILGVNLAADSPTLAAAEARALIQGVGRRNIRALEIGNEPDLYNRTVWYRSRAGRAHFARSPGYGLAKFVADFSRWRKALPRIPLAGPALALPNWMVELPRFLAAEPGVNTVTFHRYPLRGCEQNPTLADFASIPNLMSDGAASGLAQTVAPFALAAHAAGVPFRLDELNSASCTGKFGVSNTFASALWALDTLFNVASVGVDGINIHTLPGAAYEPFTLARVGGHWTGAVRPMYYGLLMFEQAFPPGARLLNVIAPPGPVKVWATEATDGQVRVVLINKDAQNRALVRVQIPGAQTPLHAEALAAPSLSATDGVTLGGQSFGASTSTGVLTGAPQSTAVGSLLGYYTVSVPAASAVMLAR
jgi:hypothetical protein